MIIFFCKELEIPLTTEECSRCFVIHKPSSTRALCRQKNQGEILRASGEDDKIYVKKSNNFSLPKRKPRKTRSDKGVKRTVRKPRSDKGKKRGPRK